MFKLIIQTLKDIYEFMLLHQHATLVTFKVIFTYTLFVTFTSKNLSVKSFNICTIFFFAIFYLTQCNLVDALGFLVFIEFSGIFMYNLLGSSFFSSINKKYIYVVPVALCVGGGSEWFLHEMCIWYVDRKYENMEHSNKVMLPMFYYVFTYNNMLFFLNCCLFLCAIMCVFYVGLKIKRRRDHIRRIKSLSKNANFKNITDKFKGKQN